MSHDNFLDVASAEAKQSMVDGGIGVGAVMVLGLPVALVAAGVELAVGALCPSCH